MFVIIHDNTDSIGLDCGRYSLRYPFMDNHKDRAIAEKTDKLLHKYYMFFIAFSMRILFFSLCPSNCTSLLQNLILINNLVDIFECLFFYMNLISNYLEFGNCRFNFTDNIAATTCLYSHFVTSLH